MIYEQCDLTEYGGMMQQPNEAITEIEQTQPQEEQAAAETEQAQPQEEKTTVEAMDKASEGIKTRVKQFASNCKFVMDVLKIQNAAVNLTDEQVATLDEETKKQYDTLVKHKDGIRTAKMDIASIFTGEKNAKLEKCKYGISGTIKDYSSKNRRVYLEKTTDGFNEIKLMPVIPTYNSEDLEYEQLENKQDLSKEQIWSLQEHVNAKGITMNDYLK